MQRRTARRATLAVTAAGAAAGLFAGSAQAATPVSSLSISTAIGDGRLAITPIPIPGALLLPPGYRLPTGGGIGPVSG